MFASLLPGAIGIALPLDQTLQLARAAGFGGVSVDIKEARQLGVGKTRELFEQAGLRLGSWSLPVQFRKDSETFEKDLASLRSLVMTAERLEAFRCSTYIMPCSDEYDYAVNFDLHADRLGQVARTLGEHGVRLGLEFVGPKKLRSSKKYQFIHDMPSMFELIGAIGVYGVGILLDSFHLFTSGGTVQDLLAITAADIIDVHLNDAVPGRAIDEQLDNERMLPGESGVIDLPAFLGALHKMGYDGPAGAEPFSKRVSTLPPEQAAAETAEAIRKVWTAAGVPWTGPRD